MGSEKFGVFGLGFAMIAFGLLNGTIAYNMMGDRRQKTKEKMGQILPIYPVASSSPAEAESRT